MPFYKKRTSDLPRSRKLEKLSEKNGLRCYIFNTVGDKYKGEWAENQKSGKGLLMTVDCDLYEGDFERNYRHGFGVMSHRIPDTKAQSLGYRGTWKDGWPDGYGLRVYRDGSYYLGQWKRGKRHGYGRMWYADKSWYDGDWVRDLRQGIGVFVRPDGNRYEGAYYKDLKHGEGRFFYLTSGQIQDGAWREDYCVFSVMCDIPFRQTSIIPSVYPIQVCCLIDREEICETELQKVLLDVPRSCLSLPSEESTDKLHTPVIL